MIQPARLVPSDGVFVAALALICALATFVGFATPQGDFNHDLFFLLDNAYRLTQGQIPHRDFSSAFGPLMFLIDAAGLELAGMNPTGLAYANILFGALLAIWVFLITRPRWSAPCACALGVFTLLLINAPFALGFNPRYFSYAMIYNRYGYALFGIMLVECAADLLLLSQVARRAATGGLSTGLVLGLLVFLKISYAMIGLTFVLLALIGGTGDRRRFTWLSAGFAASSLLILGYLHFDLHDMMTDWAMAARARQISLHPWDLVHPWIVAENLPLMLLAAWLCLCRIGLFQEAGVPWRVCWITMLTVGSGSVLMITNQQLKSFPLNPCLAALLVVMANWTARHDDAAQSPRVMSTVLLGLLCFVPVGLMDMVSLASAAMERQRPSRPHVASIQSPRGAYLIFSPQHGAVPTETDGQEYVDVLNDGLQLLRRDSGPHDEVLTFDQFNPFNYLLARPSPVGGFASAAYNFVFCEAAHPTATQFFGTTKYLMVRKYLAPGPTGTEMANVAALMRLYGPALRAGFTEVEETPHWVLWRRNGVLPLAR